ncbi:arginine permease [Suhomyces tanzawaensis NRRL Y-17324]|uniref:Arginine permease n=1 Tax=Suhomyces tanzawaensis NRRL Y-17324 TaxID=984487 RepID=A0A1E4SQL7_9ASCO|nr:arginine permease [Suhomyces tanzawaensis NRRL Y-17324]ODV81804.1 arginine permease [Suhomyces tanzawaensis NRRL Y-17324]
MIAIGGTIGTGLFISTGGTLSQAGPVSSVISFLFMTTLAFSVTQALGEMATLIPVAGSFAQFVTRWCSPALGAANGWNYWFSWAITYALELSVVGQVIGKWTDAVPLAAWISIFFVLLTLSNLFPVKYYGEIEFWIATLKVVAVVGWLLYAFIMVCGAGKTGPVGFRYWRNPGPWGPGILVENVNTGRFLGWLASLISAAFTFQGCELVGISAGESKNPHKTVPSAIRKVLFRILVFYVACMLFIGLLVPFDDPALNPGDGAAYTANSPFIIAMNNSGTKILPDIFNAVILVTIISAGNSNVYCGSRILFGLAQAGVAPKFFQKTSKHGVPWVAVLFTSAFGALGYLATSSDGNEAFGWLLNITATSGLIAWGWISFTHIRFMNILKSRNISRDSLPFKAKFMPYASYYAAVAVFIITFIQGFQAFWDIDATKFFTSYVSLILFAVCWIGFHFYFNGFNIRSWSYSSFLVPLEECDIDTGVREIDDEDWEEDEPKNAWQKFWAIIS